MKSKSIKNFFDSLLLYPRYFYSYLGIGLFIIMGFGLLIGVFDGLGLAMFLPLLQIAENPEGVNPDSLGEMKIIFEVLNSYGIELNLIVVLSFLCFFFIFKGVLVYIGNYYRVTIQQAFIRKIRLNMLHSLANIHFKTFVNSDAGRIQNTMGGEVSRLSMSLTYYLAALQSVLLVIVYITFALLINAKFAIIVIIGALITNILFKYIYIVTKRESSSLTRESNLYQGLLIQFVSNFKYLRATGNVITLEQKLGGQIDNIEKNNRKLGLLSSFITAVREPIVILIVVIAVFVQTHLIGSDIGSILVSLLFFYRALSSLLAVKTQWNYFLTMSGSMENMRDFQNSIGKNQENYGQVSIETFENALELSQATVTYSDSAVLNNISFKIIKNESVALVGKSGSGKTTLLNVLSGLIPIEKGKYYIDNYDSIDLDMRSLQRRIGYITQEPVIFTGSIYENISFWSDKSTQNLKRFNKVLEQASLTEFINDLEQKEDTLLGNNGINLSGGQRQRISIARELYKEVDILFMDEATSALDSETERAIQQSIEALKGRYTLIMVAHRLSTIKSADRIFVLRSGNIVETGDYDSLISESITFKRMVELQEL